MKATKLIEFSATQLGGPLKLSGSLIFSGQLAENPLGQDPEGKALRCGRKSQRMKTFYKSGKHRFRINFSTLRAQLHRFFCSWSLCVCGCDVPGFVFVRARVSARAFPCMLVSSGPTYVHANAEVL